MNPPNPSYDELTGLPGKEIFAKELKLALMAAAESPHPLSIGLMDIDRFMGINEQHGHALGDQVIATVAKTMQEIAGEDAEVFRYGGDEFAILFRNTAREQAFLALERIRTTVKGRESYGEGKDAAKITVNLSGGVASYPVDGDAEDELLRKASQALYRAKGGGQSRILLAYDERMIPKTTHYTETQLERLSQLAEELEVTEARLLREALDDLINKYKVNKIVPA